MMYPPPANEVADLAETDSPMYAYDYRGLKIRKDSLGKGSSDGKVLEEVKEREESPSELPWLHTLIHYV